MNLIGTTEGRRELPPPPHASPPGTERYRSPATLAPFDLLCSGTYRCVVTSETESDGVLIPAATVLIVRDGAEGLETLMLRRNSKVAFGGMWVFPGGKVDADEMIPGDVEGSARVAAAREVEEETSLTVSSQDLETWSYWIPPAQSAMRMKGPVRRFSTWFFVCAVPGGVDDVVVDGGEIHEHEWMRPLDAITRRDAGEIELVPPTWVTLWQLARHQNAADAVAWAAAHPPEEFRTKSIGRDPVTVAWVGDAGYEAGDHSLDGSRHRLTMDPSGWVYERTP